MYLSLLVTLLAIPFGMATPVGPTELTERANGYKFSGKATYYTPGLGVSLRVFALVPSNSLRSIPGTTLMSHRYVGTRTLPKSMWWL